MIDVMLDAVYAEILGDEDHQPAGWRERQERVARDNWSLYLRHPWMLHVATVRPVLGPNLTAKYDRELRAVDGIGLSDVEMDLVVTLVTDYVRGAVRGAVEATEAERRSGVTVEEWWAEFGPLLARVRAQPPPLAASVGAVAGAEYGAAGWFRRRRLVEGARGILQSNG
ncbi:MAG: TetR/AcrR family transcriptional regulator C-terminal domain-containing protein [Candidatus Dormibacteraceae bacterium]